MISIIRLIVACLLICELDWMYNNSTESLKYSLFVQFKLLLHEPVVRTLVSVEYTHFFRQLEHRCLRVLLENLCGLSILNQRLPLHDQKLIACDVRAPL